MDPVSIPADELSAIPASALCWAELMAAQFETGEVHIVSTDPMADLLRVNALRKLYQRAGAAVPLAATREQPALAMAR